MRTYVLIGLVLVMAGCGDASGEPVAETATTTTVVPATTPTAPPSTTIAPVDTDGATTTTPDPTTTATTEPVGSLEDLVLEATEVVSGFVQPVAFVPHPTQPASLVVDQDGVVWILIDGDRNVFLDISDDVSFQGEQGLLGLAFHPDFAGNGLFYVNYIANNGDTVVESFVGGAASADLGSRREILRVDQPASNHNGGMITFGPDGNLWIGLGDGGGANDQFGQGQRADTELGSMLRVAVGPNMDGYTVPDGNIDAAVWAVGLRNPWRWWFDGDDLWIADVGQGRIEEVNVVDWRDGNPNFGWSVMEGSECFGGGGCDSAGLVLPVYEYTHDEGCSVTGGVVYRGSAIPELSGHFLFADYCTGWVRSVSRSGEAWEWFPAGTFGGVTAFGLDASGEPYVVTAGGAIYAIERAQ